MSYHSITGCDYSVMSNTSEDNSLYETPMTSLNNSVVGSTRIDSSLFDTLSTTSQAMDLLDTQSMHGSVATDSTLRPTFAQKTTSSQVLMPESCAWLQRQLMSTIDDDLNDNNRCILLKKMVSELDCEHMELMAVEHQIQALSIKCKTIRQNIVSKTDFMNSLINEMVVNSNSKQRAHKETQTDPNDNERTVYDNKPSFSQNMSSDNSFHLTPNDVMSVMSVMSERETCVQTENRSHCEQTVNSNKFNSFAVLSDNMKRSMNRLPALVKGYLTRRLMKTEKVLQKMETIRETTQLLTSYHNFHLNKKITIEDINLHKRLIIQLENSCHEFYDIFFNYTKCEQMALICRSREQILDRHYRMGSVLSNSSYLSPNLYSNQSQTKALSSATKRVLERKTRMVSSKSGSNECSQSSHSSHSLSKSCPRKSLLSPKTISSSSNTSLKDSRNVSKAASRRALRHLNKNCSQTVKRNITFIKK